MKLVFAAIALSMAIPMAAQQPAKPQVAGLSELQALKVQSVVKDYVIAQKNQQLLKQAQVDSDKALQDAQAAVEKEVAKAKAEMRLGDDYTFDYQSMQFKRAAAKK